MKLSPNFYGDDFAQPGDITFHKEGVMDMAAEALDRPPGPAEKLFLAYVLAGAAAWLALTWWWRW